MDPNHDIVPTLRMFDGLLMTQAADEIDRLRAQLQTPNASLPPLGDGPRRSILVTVSVPENWESRLDMQWVLEREIAADRWSWNFPGAVNGAARELLEALDGGCGKEPVWKAEMEALRLALKSVGEKE
jgi:hypothetical protein